MSFLDGFLVRDSNTILKGASVENVLLDALESNQSIIRPYTINQVRKILGEAKKNVQGKVLLDLTEPDKDIDGKYPEGSLESNIGTGTSNPTGRAKGKVIMASLWQIKSNIPHDLFVRLQSIFDKNTKKTTRIKPMKRDEEITLFKLIEIVEKGDKISESLQNKLYDSKLLDSKFLLILDDMVTTGVRRLHPKIYDKLVEITNAGKYKGTDLYEKVVKKIELLSGNARPDRKSLLREYKLLSSGKKTSLVDIIRLVNQGRYRYQGNTTASHLESISNSINNSIDEKWDELVSNFKSVYEEYDDATKESTAYYTWAIDVLENKIDVEWESKSIEEKENSSREQLAGDKYKKIVKQIETTYRSLKNKFNAYNTLLDMIEDKGLIHMNLVPLTDMSSGSTREKDFLEEYNSIITTVSKYEEYKIQVISDLKEEKDAQKEYDLWLRRKGALDIDDETTPIRKPDKEVPLRADSDIESLRARVQELKDKRNSK